MFVYDEVRHPTGRAAQWGMELHGFITVWRVWESGMVCVYVCVCVAEWFPHCLESEESVGVRHGMCICVCVSVSVYDAVRQALLLNGVCN